MSSEDLCVSVDGGKAGLVIRTNFNYRFLFLSAYRFRVSADNIRRKFFQSSWIIHLTSHNPESYPKMFALFSGLGQNAFGLTLGTAAVPVTTVNEGLGGIDFSSSSDKKSMFF